MELEPLGGIIPTEDPYPDEEVNYVPDTYRYGANVLEAGKCTYNYSPYHCIRLEPHTRNEGVLAIGGAVIQTSIWRYTRFRLYDNESEEGNNRANTGENWKMFGNQLGIQEGESWYETYSFLTNLPMPGEPATLNDDENEELDKRIDLLLNGKLDGEKCREFLAKLGADAYDRLIKTLRDKTLRFSASRSEDITVEDAGLFGAEARQIATHWADKKNTKDRVRREYYEKRLEMLDWSVSKWAKQTRGLRAVLGEINGNRVIFYNSFRKITTIVHENLHISTGLGDVDLANTLGLTDQDGKAFRKGDEKSVFAASSAISAALIANKCTD